MELVSVLVAAFAELAGAGGKVTGGWGITNRATLPSSVTQMLPSGPVVIPPNPGPRAAAGEIEIAVRAGRDGAGAAVSGRECEFGDRAFRRDPADERGAREPEVAIRPGRDSALRADDP